MSNPTNLVSVTLTPEQVQEIQATLAHLKALCAFVIAVNALEDNAILYPGPNGVKACERMTETVERFADRFPIVVCDPIEMRADLDLIKHIQTFTPVLKELLSALETTEKAAASDLYRSSLQAYAIAKTLLAVTPGLAAAVEPIKKHLDRRSRQTATATATETTP